jgi:UDP-N-acetylglucosamine transferase subunit ALG13
VIFVTLGTHEQPMRRLTVALAGVPAAVPQLAPFVIQHGYSPMVDGWEGEPLMSPDRMRLLMDAADIVVTHGGPASIALARDAGKIPIVVPRASSFGEHVDDHQVAYGRRLALAGEIILAEDPADIVRIVADHRRLSENMASPSSHDPMPAVEAFSAIADSLMSER